MLKVIGIVVVLLVVVAVVLALTGRNSAHAELVIEATPDEVWEVITDAETYSSWNTVLVDAKGDFVEGGAVTYQMKIGDSEPSEVTPAIKQIKTSELLHQGGGMKGVLTYDHQWQLTPVEGGTQVVQHEDYTGIGVWFWDPSEVEAQYQAGLEALKTRLEGK